MKFGINDTQIVFQVHQVCVEINVFRKPEANAIFHFGSVAESRPPCVIESSSCEYLYECSILRKWTFIMIQTSLICIAMLYGISKHSSSVENGNGYVMRTTPDVLPPVIPKFHYMYAL